jgi:hypothetical protein
VCLTGLRRTANRIVLKAHYFIPMQNAGFPRPAAQHNRPGSLSTPSVERILRIHLEVISRPQDTAGVGRWDDSGRVDPNRVRRRESALKCNDMSVGESMERNASMRVCIGDLVVAVFDEASLHTSDPNEVSRLSVLTLTNLLARARKTATSLPSLASSITACGPGNQDMTG